MSKQQWVLLDLDGTLTDPFVGIAAGIRHALRVMDLSVPADDVLRTMIGPPFEDTFPALGVPASRIREAIDAYRTVYDDGGAMYNAYVYDGIIEALDHLRADGYFLSLATSKPERPARKVVEHFGIASRLDFIGAATSDGTRRTKGDVIAHVLRSTDADPSQCVMVGDRDVDILGARAHGISTIGVLWGYSAPGELASHNAAAVIRQASELRSVVSLIFKGS
jgi:phosphoglycolate phosphatase